MNKYEFNYKLTLSDGEKLEGTIMGESMSKAKQELHVKYPNALNIDVKSKTKVSYLNANIYSRF